MKMTGMAGVSSFSRASAITPVWMSQRAPGGTARRRVRVALRGDGWQERARTPTMAEARAGVCVAREQRTEGVLGIMSAPALGPGACLPARRRLCRRSRPLPGRSSPHVHLGSAASRRTALSTPLFNDVCISCPNSKINVENGHRQAGLGAWSQGRVCLTSCCGVLGGLWDSTCPATPSELPRPPRTQSWLWKLPWTDAPPSLPSMKSP